MSTYERLVNSQNFFSPYLTQEDHYALGSRKVIEESRVADKAAHFEKLHEAEDMLMADAACIPVAYYNDFWLQSPSLKGTWHSPYGYWYLQYGYIEE